MSAVPFLNLKPQYQKLREEIRAAVDRVLDSQVCIGGPELEAFEAEVAQFTSAKHAVACSNGSDAIVLALKALKIGPGDEVIVPSFTFFATAGSVSLVGAKPVFADIEADTFNICLKSVESLLTPQTKAVIPVDLFGQAANITGLKALLKDRNIPIIEDSAQAIGAEHAGQPVGSLATLTTFSFYPTKNLGACGEGGLVTTQDPALDETLRQLRNHGQSGRYEHAQVGMNARLNAVQAAILRIKLKHLPEWMQARRQHAAFYREALGDLEGKGLKLPFVHELSSRHVYNQITLRLAKRDKVRAALTDKGIGSGVYYPCPLHLQPCFQDLGGQAGQLPESERACDEVLALPSYPELPEDHRQQVVDALREALG